MIWWGDEGGEDVFQGFARDANHHAVHVQLRLVGAQFFDGFGINPHDQSPGIQ